MQEALIAAAMQWPAEGVPRNPRGWLYHVALRRLTGQVRSEIARRRREDAAASDIWAEWAFVPPPDSDLGVDQDDTLALLFMCCHPLAHAALGHRADAARRRAGTPSRRRWCMD